MLPHGLLPSTAYAWLDGFRATGLPEVFDIAPAATGYIELSDIAPEATATGLLEVTDIALASRATSLLDVSDIALTARLLNCQPAFLIRGHKSSFSIS